MFQQTASFGSPVLISASSHEINNVRFVVSWWFGVKPSVLVIYRTDSSGSVGLLPYILHGMTILPPYSRKGRKLALLPGCKEVAHKMSFIA